MEWLIPYGYAGMFASAFLAATLLPVTSEVVLAALLAAGLTPLPLVAAATAGNVLGSCVNYAMGYGGAELVRKYSDVSARALDAALARYRAWGAASLLLAWTPFLGDPLTLAAGVLRVNIPVFLVLVTAGKLGRYAALAWLVTPA